MLTFGQVFGIALTAKTIARQETDRLIAAAPKPVNYNPLPMPGTIPAGHYLHGKYNSFMRIPQPGEFGYDDMVARGKVLLEEQARWEEEQARKASEPTKPTYGRVEPPMTRAKGE